MTKQNTPASEDRAWEIFVQLVGNGRCTSYADAAIGAFNAVEAFETQRTKRRESETNTVAASGDDVAQARAENAMKQSSDASLPWGVVRKGEALDPDSPFGPAPQSR
jgi:hypothetical protein